MPFPRQKNYSCFDCQHYIADEFQQFSGYCCRHAPKGQDASGTSPQEQWAYLIQPGNLWCGEFQRFTGPKRDCGPPPGGPAVEAAMSARIEKEDELLKKVASGGEITEAESKELQELRATELAGVAEVKSKLMTSVPKNNMSSIYVAPNYDTKPQNDGEV